LAFGDAGNRAAEALCKEKIVVKKDHIGFDIKEAKGNGSMANRLKFERHGS
jgi:hypothetical protein